MRRFNQPVEKEAKSENETQTKPKEKKNKSMERLTQIATMDNVTIVEAFKYLNYCQLAKISLAVKKFCGLIRTHRNSLALLYVNNISMKLVTFPAAIKIFKRQLSPEAYNDWVIRNDYSKQGPFEDQVAAKESTQYDRQVYELSADYKNSHCCLFNGSLLYGSTTVFCARVEAFHQNWPVFQHFVRLLTDPFIYIAQVEFTPVLLNLLATAMKPDCKRLHCEELVLREEKGDPDDSVLKSIHWIKNHFSCSAFTLVHDNCSNIDEELLDFLVTGSYWTSAFTIRNYGFTQIIVNLVKKFMDLKNLDENQIVLSIRSNDANQVVRVLNRNYAKFIIVKTEEGNRWQRRISTQIFEFVNNNIRKKMQITTRIFYDWEDVHEDNRWLFETIFRSQSVTHKSFVLSEIKDL